MGTIYRLIVALRQSFTANVQTVATPQVGGGGGGGRILLMFGKAVRNHLTFIDYTYLKLSLFNQQRSNFLISQFE